MKKSISLFILLTLSLFTIEISGQTTGKISGRVKDAETGEPLPGAQVMITSMWFDDIEVDMASKQGAVTNVDGNYFIINVSPGVYTVEFQMMGFETTVMKQVVVSTNRTTNLNVDMSTTTIQGEEVVVEASMVSVKKDLTSSVKNVSADKIQSLPVENMKEVVEMQAGIVAGHFRGGRKTEVTYMIDGMQVDERYSGEESMVEVETEAIQDLEVITGTFNAEYGKAMSGVVNAVTKDGRDDFHGSASLNYSNYYTGNSDVFIGLKNSEFFRNQDYKVQLEGPIWKNKITFFTNFRFENRDGYLNGINRFEPDNYSDFQAPNDRYALYNPWGALVNDSWYYSEHTGDDSYVPMNSSETMSFLGKLSFRFFDNIRFSAMYTYNDDQWQSYSHGYKYKPKGRATNYDNTGMFLILLNHLISNSFFYDLKLSYSQNTTESYLYKNPLDSRYISNMYGGSVGGFAAGGQDHGLGHRELNVMNVKYDMTWQATNRHSLKLGALYTEHELVTGNQPVRNKYWNSPLGTYGEFNYETGRFDFPYYEPEFLPDSSISIDNYTAKAKEYSVYAQDKMEFDEMTINLGLRLDAFDPNTTYPSNRRNPANQLSFPDNPERESERVDADIQYQLSPRFGLSYTLGDKAVLHFSYGHFFQMPPLYAVYSSHRNLVPTGDFGTIHGNPEIKAEKTVQYEIGLWQELMPGMGLEVSVFYRDVYDLQSAVVITTYNQIQYGLYSNKDYGNTKGLEVKYDYGTGPLSLGLNYTLQYTRGNADNPQSTYNRLGENQDPIAVLVPLSWDQRHTANASLNYNNKNYSASLIAYYNSGLPYTYSPPSWSPLVKQTLLPNNNKRPSTVSLDFKGHYDISLSKSNKIRLSMSIYNLLDRLNEVYVNSTTGRAYTALLTPTQISNFRSNFNDIYDSIENPAMYSAPREIKFGIGYVF